jgi:molybdopterin converting factor small subunit
VATVYIPAPLRRQTGGQSRIQIPGATVREVLANLGTAYPGVGEQVLDPSGRVRAYINIFVNGDEIRALAGEETPVGAQDEVSIIPAMAGGGVVPAMAGGRQVRLR